MQIMHGYEAYASATSSQHLCCNFCIHSNAIFHPNQANIFNPNIKASIPKQQNHNNQHPKQTRREKEKRMNGSRQRQCISFSFLKMRTGHLKMMKCALPIEQQPLDNYGIWNIHLSFPHYKCNHKEQQKQHEDSRQTEIHLPAGIESWLKLASN